MLKWVAKVTLAAIIGMSVFRVLLYLGFKDKYFSHFDIFDVLLGLGHGIRFDTSVFLTFTGIPFLLLLMPLPFNLSLAKKLWIYILHTLIFLVIAAFTLHLIGNLFYFYHMGRHVFDELLTLSHDWNYVLSTIKYYKFEFVLFFIFLVSSYYLWLKVTPIEKTPSLKEAVFFLIVSAVLIRGSLGLKPINIVDGFITEDSNLGQFVLNGAFTAWHASRNTQNSGLGNLISDEDLDSFYKLNNLEKDAEFPYSKELHHINTDKKKLNLVFILLESWQHYYVDSFANNGFGATPHFDKLAKEGLMFTNFYANGSRSIEALQAILTSFPALKGLPTLGSGFELLQTSKLGLLAHRNGYQTIFSQSARRESFRLDSVSKALGFRNYYGKEDFPTLIPHNQEEPAFGWDYEHLDYLANKLGQIKKPFLSFSFTGTTHTPFVLPHKFLDSKGHGKDNETGFLNTMHYADWALGKFIEKLKGFKWFEDTIFIFTADHAFPSYRNFSFLDRYKVPLLIYAPKYIKPEINKNIGSHIDLLPTISHLLNFSGKISSPGRNLCDNFHENNYYAIIYGKYDNPAIIGNFGYMQHNFKNRLNSQTLDCDHSCLSRNELRILGENQALFNLIKKQSWVDLHNQP